MKQLLHRKPTTPASEIFENKEKPDNCYPSTPGSQKEIIALLKKSKEIPNPKLILEILDRL